MGRGRQFFLVSFTPKTQITTGYESALSMGVHPGSFPYEVAVPGKQRNRNFLQQRRRPNGSKIKTIYRLTVVANFVAITQSLLENVKWRWISLELNYSGPNPSFGGKRKIRGRVFTCSIKRRIRELHVVVVHWRQGNEQKSVMLFCLLNLFFPFSWRSRCLRRRRR